MSRPDPPPPVRWITRTLEEAGFETWAVGGAVRDALSGRPSADWDLATRARPDQIQRLFPRTVPIGVDHGTVGVLDRQGTLHEVTTFRRDVETTGRHAVVVFADSLVEDLARRDFTINAVAWHPLRGEYLDPHGGREDLERSRLRTVGAASERFAEDYLRVLRALRFAGRFRLVIGDTTWRALVAAVPEMGRLSAERIHEELEKVLGADAMPSGALSLYAASGALDFLYPELGALVAHEPATAPGIRGTPAPNRPRSDLWTRTLAAVDLTSVRGLDLRFAALLHEVGAPEPEARREEQEGAVVRDPAARAEWRAAAVLTRLRSSRARIRRVTAWVRGIATEPGPGASGAELRRWLARLGRDEAPGAMRLLAVVRRARSLVAADVGAHPNPGTASLVRRLRAELRSGTPLSERELALDGRDLIRMGFRPGPEFGEVLRELLDLVLDEPELNRKSVLAAEAERRLHAMGSRRGPGRDD